MITIHRLPKIIIDHKSRDWCKLPYPGHPYGCPNYGNRPDCPPIIDVFENLWDMSKPFDAVVCTFDMKHHIERMLSIHPDWTDRQCRCCLYWQNGVRKELNNAIITQKAVYLHSVRSSSVNATLLPEAQGVNVFATMRQIGVKIMAKPKDVIYKVAIVGTPIAVSEDWM